MNMRSAFAAATLLFLASEAGAQSLPSFSAEVTTDHRRRGLSWSDGQAAVEGTVSSRIGETFRLSAGAVTLRDSPRHGGADAAVDLTIDHERSFGPWRLNATVAGHVFPGHGNLSYVELGAGAGVSVGPAQIDLFGMYAPSQNAIGGDNLYLGASAAVALIGTPFTLTGSVGRSSGDTDDPWRSARLRPGGSYVDYRIGIDHILGPLTVGVAYSGTTVDRDALGSPYADFDDAGDKLIARARLSF